MGQMCSAADTSSRNSVSPLYLAPVLDFLTSKHIEAQRKVWCFVFLFFAKITLTAGFKEYSQCVWYVYKENALTYIKSQLDL